MTFPRSHREQTARLGLEPRCWPGVRVQPAASLPAPPLSAVHGCTDVQSALPTKRAHKLNTDSCQLRATCRRLEKAVSGPADEPGRPRTPARRWLPGRPCACSWSRERNLTCTEAILPFSVARPGRHHSPPAAEVWDPGSTCTQADVAPVVWPAGDGRAGDRGTWRGGAMLHIWIRGLLHDFIHFLNSPNFRLRAGEFYCTQLYLSKTTSNTTDKA